MTTSRRTARPVFALVVPCYNEEEIISTTIGTLDNSIRGLIKAKLISEKSFAVYIDDGSQDKTYGILSSEAQKNLKVRCVKLSRNFGHQAALLAGLEAAVVFADCLLSIDADLQDDTERIPEFIDAYKRGNDIVYGVRIDRSTDSLFKRNSARVFYKLQESFGLKVIKQHADFRLMSNRAVQTLLSFPEKNLFLRGIVPLLGFNSAIVPYARSARMAGVTKYPLRKMLALAVDGITSFSIKPLRFVTYLGMVMSLASLSTIGWILTQKLFSNSTVPGWASTISAVFLLGGLQMLSLGIVGEYVGKIFFEVKNRPRYIVAETQNFNSKGKT